MKLRSARTLVPVAVCALAIGALLIGGISRNVVYFRTVSEAVESRAEDGRDRVRVAGAVVPGSTRADAGEVTFELTDGRSTLLVRHRGDPPELFDDGAPVVSEGRWVGDEFSSDRLMIKHGSEYAPPEVDAAGASTADASSTELPPSDRYGDDSYGGQQ